MTDHTLAPVALIHGFGSSFAHGWERTGWVDLLEDAGREVVPVALPGHPGFPGDMPTTHDEVDAAMRAQLPEGEVDIIAFSAGAIASLRVLVSRVPVRRAVLLGLGDGMLNPTDPSLFAAEIAAGGSGVWRRMLVSADADPSSVAAFARLDVRLPALSELARVSTPLLLITGDRDTLGAPARIAASLPDARAEIVTGADHMALPSDPRAMILALQFLIP